MPSHPVWRLDEFCFGGRRTGVAEEATAVAAAEHIDGNIVKHSIYSSTIFLLVVTRVLGICRRRRCRSGG